MVAGLKQSTPFVVQAIPEVTFNRQWLTEKISDNIENLIEIRVCLCFYFQRLCMMITYILKSVV